MSRPADSLDERVEVLLEAMEEEIDEWHKITLRSRRSLRSHLGMTPEDWGLFVISPREWAKAYLTRLHGG